MNYYNLISMMPKAPAYDADAQAFITATGISGTNASAINTLVIDLKAASIWTKMKALYPMVGGTATTHKFNLKNPLDTDAAFRLVFNGGWTHSNNGALPNGTNGYANTFFIPSSHLTLNSAALGYYGGNNLGASVNKCAIGSVLSGKLFSIEPAYTAFGLFGDINDGSGTFTTNTNTSGFIFASRNVSNQKTHSIRGLQTIKTENSTGIPTVSVMIGARNNGTTSIVESYSAFQHRFDFISDGLTNSESTALHNAVQTFQTTLSRNV